MSHWRGWLVRGSGDRSDEESVVALFSMLYAREESRRKPSEADEDGGQSVWSETQGLGMRRGKQISGLAASGAYEGASQVPGKWPLRKYSDAREMQGMQRVRRPSDACQGG